MSHIFGLQRLRRIIADEASADDLNDVMTGDHRLDTLCLVDVPVLHEKIPNKVQDTD